MRVANSSRWLTTQVVAVHGHIGSADRNPDPFHLIHHRCQPMGQGDTPGRYSHQHQVIRTAVRLENLMGDPGAGASDLITVKDNPRVQGTGPDALRRIIPPGRRRAGI
jgi:hypothetical protein